MTALVLVSVLIHTQNEIMYGTVTVKMIYLKAISSQSLTRYKV